jgi:hypothetical protein
MNLDRAPARAEAKRNHPASSWRPERDRFRRRVGERLCDEGCEWPDLVAAVLELRAGLRLDQAGLAVLLHVDAAVIKKLEAGRLAPGAVLPALVGLRPEIDWAALAAPHR